MNSFIKYTRTAVVVFLGIVLSACATSPSATPTSQSSSALDAVYTAAAGTLTAQPTASLSTVTMEPTSSPIATLSNTTSSALNAASVDNTATPASMPTNLVTVNSCDNSVYVSDISIPDGTVVAPGQSFTKTWEFQNTGSCAWTTSYTLAFVSGNSMNGGTTNLSTSTSPGGTLNVSVSMIAPASAGNYTGYWKMQNASGAWFGGAVYVQIVVSTDAATVTPTTTPTPSSSTATMTHQPSSTSPVTPTSSPVSNTATPTKTASPTTTQTNTPTPTAVPTQTASPTTTP